MPVGSAIIEEFLGVNLSKHPLRLEDNELSFAMNTYPRERGLPDMRPNGVLLGVAGKVIEGGLATADGGRSNMCGIVQFYDYLDKHHLLTWQFRADSANSGVFSMRELLNFNMDGSSAVNVALSFRPIYLDPSVPNPASFLREKLRVSGSKFRRPAFVANNGKLYIFVGEGNPLVLEPGVQDSLGLIDGGGGDQLSYWGCVAVPWNVASGGAPPQFINGTTATFKDTQMVLGGVPGFPNKLFCADPNDPGNFSAVAPATRGIDVGTSEDPIVEVRNIAVLGGADAVEAYLLVLKRSSTWMIQGPLPSSTSDGDIRAVPLMRTEGCVSKMTVVETPTGVMWCSGRNVYIMEPGQQPRAVGDNISEYLKTLPSSSEDPAWHACWDTAFGCYRLNVPRGLASPELSRFEDDNLSGPSTYPMEQWWCDMRVPATPAWWGPMTLSGVNHMQEFREPGGALLGLWTPMGATSQGPTAIASGPHLCVLSTYTVNNFDWADYYALSKSDHPKQRLRTRVFTAGDPFIMKILEAVEIFFSLSPLLSTEFNVLAYVVRNMRPAPRLMNPATYSLSTLDRGDDTMILGVGTLDAKGFGEGFNSIALTPIQVVPTDPQRLNAITFQVSIESANMLGGNVRPRMRLASMGVRFRPVGRRSTGHNGD